LSETLALSEQTRLRRHPRADVDPARLALAELSAPARIGMTPRHLCRRNWRLSLSSYVIRAAC
jgi:hypothetical protein